MSNFTTTTTVFSTVNMTEGMSDRLDNNHNYSEWGLEDNIECYGATDDEMEIYAKISFW